ncbi:Telomerase protein component 1 [Coniosporium tulheliwenetii]|uniref:Telomerase protein component 1 n=1 Tax=Coniosporium tulheliwenetii TaxID=3383036 RepID=A0ACC2YND8_9PEZI|nr:Telomerase protein component 1 [Cladosporium sp. JES 115]
MASLLRQIVASPRVRHPEANLDLCYVTDNIIATSGPSGTYPQRYYRNPLDSLVRFLDSRHGDKWAIWEFRAEGTGYPDEEVYGRIYHFPWPDHHPPPFALLPRVVASMRNWLRGTGTGVGVDKKDGEGEGRVVVVHCKAGKGRSGTASCAYLISEEGWTLEDALQRFTERRMRPGFGPGISIPSQLRWIGYVDRWTRHGKVYVERQVEVLEVHVWGLRDGVKIAVEGFVDEGRRIETFHTFGREECNIVRGSINGKNGFADVVAEVMGRRSGDNKGAQTPTSAAGRENGVKLAPGTDAKEKEEFKGAMPSKRVVLPTNDINIDFERRNNANFGLTMVTAVAHVWFNAFFEGNGAENGGKADSSGVFELEWDRLDGIKGSRQKGTRAFDKFAVVWKALPDEEEAGIVIHEPKEDEEAKQSQPADWKGNKDYSPGIGKKLGLRAASPHNGSVSRASSTKSDSGAEKGEEAESEDGAAGVRPYGPGGETRLEVPDSPIDGSSDSPDSPISGPKSGPGEDNRTSINTSPPVLFPVHKLPRVLPPE